MLPLSQHFTFEEANATSHRDVINVAPLSLIPVLKKTAEGAERVRALLNDLPMHITSWYRCLLLNRLIGSKDSSQHIKGEAIDFICPSFGSPYDICKVIVDNSDLINFDQLIYEGTWVHISFSEFARKEVLTLGTGGSYRKGLIAI